MHPLDNTIKQESTAQSPKRLFIHWLSKGVSFNFPWKIAYAVADKTAQ